MAHVKRVVAKPKSTDKVLTELHQDYATGKPENTCLMSTGTDTG